MGLIGSLVCIIEQCMIHQVWEWKWSKTTPFPVMSVMNVTTVISNSRGRKKNKTEMKTLFLSIFNFWFQCSTNSISSAYCDPVTVFILDQYPQQSRGSSLASLPGLEYRRIGLSDCFQASLEIQISSPSIMRGGRTNLILLVSLFVFPQRLLKFAIQTEEKGRNLYQKEAADNVCSHTHTYTHNLTTMGLSSSQKQLQTRWLARNA